MTKFEKERKWTSVIHFHKKAVVNLAKCTITAHAHDMLYSYTGMTCRLSYYTVQ